jgi:hypothetical protein
MGYPHYFAYDPSAESFVNAWSRMVADSQLIVAYVQTALAVPLADSVGDGDPEITERWIRLNGPTADDLGHESFVIDPSPWKVWDEQAALGHVEWANCERAQLEATGFVTGFCKTARKPYDIAVTTVLLRCRHLAPDAFVIASDGDWKHEWQYGAMHWHPGCVRCPGSADVVRALFGQIETLACNRLDPSVCNRAEPARTPRRA